MMDGMRREKSVSICRTQFITAFVHRRMWTIDNCIPMRCRITANADRFQDHDGSEMAKINTRRAPQSWRGHPCSALFSPARHRSACQGTSRRYTRPPNFSIQAPSSPLPNLKTMLFGLGNLFYGTSRLLPFKKNNHFSPHTQFQSSSSTPSPSYQKTDFLPAVCLPFKPVM